MRPEVSVVGVGLSLPGCGEGLTREARREEIHAATPASAIEGRKVVPERSRM
jgi:hypothetical protein